MAIRAPDGANNMSESLGNLEQLLKDPSTKHVSGWEKHTFKAATVDRRRFPLGKMLPSKKYHRFS